MATTAFFRSSNNLERFRKKVPGQKNNPKDINSRIAPNGDFEVLEGLDVIITAVRRLLIISDRTYLFDPEFGVGLHRYIFEPCDDKSLEQLNKEIKRALRRYEDRAKFSVNITQLKDRKGFRIDIEIHYQGDTKRLTQVYDESLLRTVD